MSTNYKDSNKPTKKSAYRQGYYKLENPDKYTGDPSKIIYRSSWEYKFCRYCDFTNEVVNWSSEPFAIKYLDPIKKKQREYYVDFFIRVAKGGTMSNYLVEVKPKAKLKAPILEAKQTLKRLKEYNSAMEEFIVNKAKKEAAEAYAHAMGYKYMIITEDFLFNKDNDKS
jgi:hypothetical protein